MIFLKSKEELCYCTVPIKVSGGHPRYAFLKKKNEYSTDKVFVNLEGILRSTRGPFVMSVS